MTGAHDRSRETAMPFVPRRLASARAPEKVTTLPTMPELGRVALAISGGPAAVGR